MPTRFANFSLQLIPYVRIGLVYSHGWLPACGVLAKGIFDEQKECWERGPLDPRTNPGLQVPNHRRYDGLYGRKKGRNPHRYHRGHCSKLKGL